MAFSRRFGWGGTLLASAVIRASNRDSDSPFNGQDRFFLKIPSLFDERCRTGVLDKRSIDTESRLILRVCNPRYIYIYRYYSFVHPDKKIKFYKRTDCFRAPWLFHGRSISIFGSYHTVLMAVFIYCNWIELILSNRCN